MSSVKVRMVMLIAVLMGFAVVFGAQGARLVSLAQAAADPNVDIQLITKPSGGYFGDTVSIQVTNNTGEDIVVAARVGDVLVNRSAPNQNLVVTKNLQLRIPAGNTERKEGIWTACLLATHGAPDSGDIYDVVANLSRWSFEAAQGIVAVINASADQEDYELQSAIWEYGFPDIPRNTDTSDPSANYLAPSLLREYVPNLEVPDTPDDTGGLGTGNIQVTLRWTADVDLDLWVEDPTGTIIYHDNRTPENSAGRMDRDANRLCDRSGMFGGSYVENIFYLASDTETGTIPVPVGSYIVSIVLHSDCRIADEEGTNVAAQLEIWFDDGSRLGDSLLVLLSDVGETIPYFFDYPE